MLKMDRFLADANWDMVEKYTFIINPYHKKDTDDKVLMIDEFLYPSMRYSTCPECHSRVFNEPTPKEHFEMANDARVRYLKTEKVSTGCCAAPIFSKLEQWRSEWLKSSLFNPLFQIT